MRKVYIRLKDKQTGDESQIISLEELVYNQDGIEFAFQPITKQQYEEIVKEATETSTKIFQEIANNMPKECVEQAINQLTPEKAKEVMDELKKTYEIDEETGTIGKHISY